MRGVKLVAKGITKPETALFCIIKWPTRRVFEHDSSDSSDSLIAVGVVSPFCCDMQ